MSKAKKKAKPPKKTTPPTEKKLTAKQRRFVEEYLIDLNQTQAAIRAGYSSDSARDIGCELMATPHIALAVSKAKQGRSERTQITADRVLKELARIAFADMKTFAKWGGGRVELIDSDSLDLDDTAAVLEVTETVTEGGGSLKIKLHDKKPVLELLCRHVGICAKDGGPQSDEGGPELSPPLTDTEIANSIAIAKGLKK